MIVKKKGDLRMFISKNIQIKKLIEKYKDDRFYKEVFETEVYAPVRELENLDTVIDLGALSGEFSFWISDRAKQVYAIEPEPEHYKELVENIEFVESKNIKPFNIALGDTHRMGHVTVAGRGGSSLSEDATPTDRDVVVYTLATFMKVKEIEHIDVLKVDIENGEKAVFESEDFATVADKIDIIIGEHVAAMSHDRLTELGFTREDYEFGSMYKRI